MNQPRADVQQRVGLLTGLVAGYAGHRTVQIGLQHGIFTRLVAHADGVGPAELAAEAGLDPFYLEVWCQSAHAAGVLEASEAGYRIDPAMAMLLTDRDSPAYIGGLFAVLDQPEVFDVFAERLPTGQRTWWNEVGPDFIQGAADTTRPAYLRLVPEGLAQIPGLDDVLVEDAAVLDLACGVGFGLAHLSRTYPSVRLVGIDGDAFSLQLAASALEEAKLAHRVELIHSTLEDFDRPDTFVLAIVNLAMHECRDIDKVTDNLRRALRLGGYVVISDFPFPASPEGLRSIPGRIMSAIQFFEAQIDDQLLPTQAYVELLNKHGFEAVDSFDITPTHAVTHGRVPTQ